MKKVLVLSSIALLYASLGWAQDAATKPSDQSATTTTSASNANPSTIQGCLNGSDGNYTLTQDSTGTVFNLAGSVDKLKEHVGHEVAVTGQLAGDSGPSTPSSGSADSSGTGNSTLQVSEVKMISQQCGSAPQR